ncbi:hypothetical protein D3C79_777730 [compost metagenome]
MPPCACSTPSRQQALEALAGWHERFLQFGTAGPRLVLWCAYLCRVDDRAVHRPAHAAAAPLLGDGNRLHRFQPIRWAYQLQGPVSGPWHAARRWRGNLPGAAAGAVAVVADRRDRPVDRHIAVPLAEPAHREQLRADAGRLYAANDRPGGGRQPAGSVRRCFFTCSGNLPGDCLRSRGRRDFLATTPGARGGWRDRKLVQRSDPLQRYLPRP